MKTYFSQDLIKKAIARKIRECLVEKTADGYIYPLIFADKIQQGAVEPFFVIEVIDIAQRNGMRNNYWRTYQMKIRYYEQEQNLSRITDLRVMGERFLGILDEIDVEYEKQDSKIYTRPLKAKKVDFQIIENVLVVFCTYKVKVYVEQEPATKMKILDIEQEDF